MVKHCLPHRHSDAGTRASFHVRNVKAQQHTNKSRLPKIRRVQDGKQGLWLPLQHADAAVALEARQAHLAHILDLVLA